MTSSDFKRWLDNVLVAIVFLVFAGFVWFVFSVTGAFAGIPLGYKLWMRLWLPLFQPALGILMAGALLSGVWGWWEKRRQRSEKVD
ncbi:hypothetical protein [Thermostichus vulcanus]|uniref:Uncharacterized protein n=1 Tax=Thermostichus vulcanus str. 'Rupite' TaxID=2813851 RepID=A0ABT0CE01_THEVL|nr:hypothetical protein [Thermostichus vulcanus]MCJ2543942.1 hypothetical protein [Thermostichus vulcanus str. 'Rupite']